MRFLYPLIVVLLVSSCTNSADQADVPPAATQKQKAAAPAQSQATTNAALSAFIQAVAKCTTVDFSFTTAFGSASSAIDNINQIRGMAKFFTANTARNEKNCPFEGGAVFFSEEGDILAEMDFTLKAQCRHARLRLNGKYSYHEFSEDGVMFLTQFMGIVNNVGTQGAPK